MNVDLLSYCKAWEAPMSSMFDSMLTNMCAEYGYERSLDFGIHPGWCITRADTLYRTFQVELDWARSTPAPPIDSEALFSVTSGAGCIEGSFQFRLDRPFDNTKMPLRLVGARIEKILHSVLPVLSAWNPAMVIAEGLPWDTTTYLNLDAVKVFTFLHKRNASSLRGKLINDSELESILQSLRRSFHG